MNIVDVIRPGSLNKIIGPSGTLKRIIKYRDYFLSRGYDISIFTHDDMLPNRGNVPSTKVAKVSKLAKFKSYLRSLQGKYCLIAWVYLTKDYIEMKRLVKFYLDKNRTPEYMVFHSNLECYVYHKMSKYKGAKIVMFQHSDGIPLNMEMQYYPCLEGTRLQKIMKYRFNYAVDVADRIVFITHVGEENFLKHYPNLPKDKTTVMLNGIDDLTPEQKSYVHCNLAKHDNFKYKLICCGTINYRKGHRIIMEALARVKKEVLPLIHITCVGDGAERIELEEFARINGIEKNVAFIGARPNEEIYKYLAESNIYILMSKNEGLPISIIEALRAGLGVISTNVAGIPELVNDTNGILIEPEVDALTGILDNIESYNWDSMGKVSRSRFENEFTFDRMRSQYCDMLDSLK